MEHPPPRPKSKPEEDAASSPAVESRLEFSGEVAVEHHATPPDGPADLKIHPRHPLPSVPKAPSPTTKEDEKDG
jgi:hypothetical protein